MLPSTPDGTMVEGLEVVARVFAQARIVRLVEQFNAIAGLSMVCTDSSYRLNRTNAKHRIPANPRRIRRKVVGTIFATTTTSVLATALPTRCAMKVHQHLQTIFLGRCKYLVDPHAVFGHRQDRLQCTPPNYSLCRSSRCSAPRHFNDIPIPQWQAHDAKTELRHQLKMFLLDIQIQKFSHAQTCIRRVDITKAQFAPVSRLAKAFKKNFVCSWES
mmetsp:Transcript_99993/g.198359  ORF Transcript_99993/g.198359 Transcript_99993/m.198359 type:complete len:216 (+) Transcript_99993:673-1320(+)